mmetsp:Transcript_70949/g.115191  ORF Transcript_70949/g.115191 Transcript_70949/m.115191 type:complete len:107 (+) Transcript_70949:14-334(+)
MSHGQCLIWMSHVAGSMLGGYIMDTRGSIFLYRAAAALSFVTLCVYLAVTLNYNGSASLFEKKALNTLLKPLEPQPTLQHTATHTTTNSNTPLEPQPDQAPELRQE